ncbi:hypothetical protein SCOR_30550 [Sulfidibacter corallicola]|uniref:Uncharacterized protein n=1 Tax=Sulfidibacter corallicola TaxID=2818388 RepID=A0A8A4TMI5_SULCO|nr:hypothetical protein [Sulfidibacter corallicola]QTD50101.1 hypothetical protein J3U87_31340 [Sulfidibacter corallicola]
MLTFKLFEGGLYLAEPDFPTPQKATLAFMFQSESRTDPTFDLSQSTWTSSGQQGYFLFFAPSDSRDWSTFASQARALFQATESSQFGWFDDSGDQVKAETLVLVQGQGTATPSVQTPFNLAMGNITLNVQASPFEIISISYDDTQNRFQFAAKMETNFSLLVVKPGGGQQFISSSSDTMTVPMDSGGTANAGSIGLTFSMGIDDLSAFEAGLMFFAPPQQGLVVALSYPVVQPASGSNIGFQAWLDINQTLNGTRTYFQFQDTQIGSYFADNAGRSFTLGTTDQGVSDQTSRFVLANRPIQEPTQTGTYYLTLAGAFSLASTDGAKVGANGESTDVPLLCGVTGTEFLSVDLSAAKSDDASAGVDGLFFQPDQPAYRITGGSGDDPLFLSSESGNITTSWVSFETSAGTYVSQPQASPLYQQNGEAKANLGDSSGLDLYLLDFLPLATWTPGGTGDEAKATATAAPLVPMAPYAGIPTLTDLTPFLEMESGALNPSRRTIFSNAQSEVAEAQLRALDADNDLQIAMTPQGFFAGLEGDDQVWTTTQFAITDSLEDPSQQITLQFTQMGTKIRQTLQQNQIFAVISTTEDGSGQPLFDFSGTDQQINIAGWPFLLSPEGTPASDEEHTPPIVLLKFFPGQTIKDLVDDLSLWSKSETFNDSAKFSAEQAQTYLQGLIQNACEAVYGAGNCPDGTPSGTPDTNSIYYNFYQVVTDPEFSGVLAVNANMELNALPTAIKAVTGGMTVPGPDGPVSNIQAFRVHHVGVAINDTDAQSATPQLSQSSLFGLVDYEKPSGDAGDAVNDGVEVFYNFEVEFLRALFTNSELSSFSCKINLTINNLFDTTVTLNDQTSGLVADQDGDDNIIVITGSYQAHSESGDDSSSGEGLYSFVAEGNFVFTFGQNPYLDNITLTKLQFSFDNETPNSDTSSHISAGFSLWGNMTFKELDVLDIFSFQKLTFADLGISVGFDLNIPAPPDPPTTSDLSLSFAPGNLRLDVADSPPKKGDTSLLSLLPFKLKSFLYSQHADETLESLNYYALSAVPGLGSVSDTFNFALIFDMDLGSLGALVGDLSAFKFSFIIGWLSGEDGGIAFGVQLPEADGRLQIRIEGVLNLVIEQFVLKYVQNESGDMLVLALHNSYLELLGQRLPPGTALFDFALFAPAENSSDIGWIAAINNTGGDEDVALLTSTAADPGNRAMIAHQAHIARQPHIAKKSRAGQQVATAGKAGTRGKAPTKEGGDGDGDGSPVFQLKYLGGGQRVGPDPTDPPTNFADFLKFMTTTFWDDFSNNEFDKVYHPEGQWLVISDFQLLGIIEVGFAFYDVTPFYSLTLNVTKLFNFEITYTKISDSIGLFFAKLSLPDSLRTFQVGAASLTLPSLAVSVYTNGNWKVDVGFPEGDDWSNSFRVQAFAGPIPVTGSGGFYLASLSSATSDVFKGDYPSILAFGFAARVGVGKDFTAGPLKAGVSLTFFGIIEGAAGYLSSGSDNIFQSPDALSLKGQFGVIGELYGTVDFVIIKASVNVNIQASIGVQLAFERSVPDSGSILLYVQASVKLSVSVKIGFGFFSVSISFSFSASFRFEWNLVGSGSSSNLIEDFRVRALTAPIALALVPGLDTTAPVWFLPEATVVFTNDSDDGTPYLVSSFGIEFDPQPSADVQPSDYKPFEAITTQLVTWALGHVLQESGTTFDVTLEQLTTLDSEPDVLVGWITYDDLIDQLKNFTITLMMPPQPAQGDTLNGATFPVFPFLNLKTSGRLDGQGNKDDFDYTFSSKNLVSDQFIDEIDEYFSQLLVNQFSDSDNQKTAMADTSTPLAQVVFLNYFTGLVRGGVHQLLETLQNEGSESSPIDTLIQKAVGTGQFANLAGQMSGYFRGGPRLPFTQGLTIPTGTVSTTTNPLYALTWQEFAVGDLSGDGDAKLYSVNITSTEDWVGGSASWDLTESWLSAYEGIKAGDLAAPGTPSQLPFTNVGPQSFSYKNSVTWNQAGGDSVEIRAFPPNQLALQAALAGAMDVLVMTRETGTPFLPDGTPVDTSEFSWATEVELAVSQIPAGTGGTFLKDTFALSGSSEQNQVLLEQIIRAQESGQIEIESIQVLYQEESGAAGLNSGTVDTSQVFALRTNTTTVSAPPAGPNLVFRALLEEDSGVPVGATIAEFADFLQIIQQAAVTNAPGYYLRYIETDGNSLPEKLFPSAPGQITLLVQYKDSVQSNSATAPTTVQPFFNALVLDKPDGSLLYYSETTDPSLDTQYSAVAAGAVGAELTRSDSSMKIAADHAILKSCGIAPNGPISPADLMSQIAASGETDLDRIFQMAASAGSGVAQLNSLYSLLSYQVQKTTGFIQSNLSTPIQPQQPDDAEETDENRDYRVFVPLYNVAQANQDGGDRPPNRYADIGEPFTVDFFQNDAFGNQMPNVLDFDGTNYYFDPIVPVDQWQGIVLAFDFLAGTTPVQGSFSVYLEPSEQAFSGMSNDEAQAALQHYYTIQDQITATGISFYVETNVVLDDDGSMVKVELSGDQQQAIVTMVGQMVTYLEDLAQGKAPSFDVEEVTLTVAVTGSGTLPPAFELASLIGIERDKNLISPLLKDAHDNVTFPAAQNVSSNVPATVNANLPDGQPITVEAFAADFVKAFPDLLLSVGLNDADEPGDSTATLRRKALKANGVPGDGSGSGRPGPQSLWAVQHSLIDIQVGQSKDTGPYYMSPQPLDNTLDSGTVPLPELPQAIQPANWAASQTFTDVDLDQLNATFFQAVDGMLAAPSAAQSFEQARTAYDTIAEGRQSLAEEYSRHEIEWLFSAQAPFTGNSDQLNEGREAFDQQMRAALMTAYLVDTVVQYGVTWSQVPADVSDDYALFGQVQPTVGDLPKGFTISTAQVPVQQDGSSLLTFLFGVADIQDTASVSLDLQFNVTHVQYFTESSQQVPAGEARPSIWLQLVNPYPDGVPHVGPTDTQTEIPLVFRQFPTPPTLITQTATGGAASKSTALDDNPLVAAAAWHFNYSYQGQFTVHDEILTSITYNTDLSANGGGQLRAAAIAENQVFTLFQALARFSATWTVLRPILSNLQDPNWAAAAQSFADRVTEVVNNSDWNTNGAQALLATLQNITDSYTVLDTAQSGDQRQIQLTWSSQQGESSFPDATLQVRAIAPDGQPYPNQVQTSITDGLQTTYTAQPPIVDDWIIHGIEVDNLNVLSAENALPGVQVERNLIAMKGPDGTTWYSQNNFVYKTPVVRPTTPSTPLVDNADPIDIAQLPNQGISTGCPSSSDVPGEACLCQRIYTMVYDLLADPGQSAALRQAQVNAGAADDQSRRVKIAASFRYPINDAAGSQPGQNPILPVYPIVLARSFVIDAASDAQLDDLAQSLALAVANWAQRNGVVFGNTPQPASGQIVFDMTLYAQLSGLNTPVLRLRDLFLNLSDVTD